MAYVLDLGEHGGSSIPKSLESQASNPTHHGGSEGERKRDKVIRKLREAKQKHHDKHHPSDKDDANTSPKGANFEEVEKDIHARAAFVPILPGEEDNLDEVKATVEALVHSRHLTAGQAFSLCSQLDSSDPVEQVSAREIIAALQAELADAEPESESSDNYEELSPVAKSNVKTEDESATGNPAPLSVTVKGTQVMSSQSATLTKLPPLAPPSGDQKKKGSKPPQVDPRLDVMCSLMSTDGLKKFLETQYIVPEDEAMTHHEDLHCLALASAVPPASSSNDREKKASQ